MRPRYWEHLAYLALRKVRSSSEEKMFESDVTLIWDNALSTEAALAQLGIDQLTAIDKEVVEDSFSSVKALQRDISGPAHIHLLYTIAKHFQVKKILETGVAFGWSSMSFLYAMRDIEQGLLVSVDLPYPVSDSQLIVGAAVPASMRKRWTLLIGTDRSQLPKVYNLHGPTFDLCHYDSDKSISGRKFAYPILWESLRPGGVFVSDDVQDNLFFLQFFRDLGVHTIVVKFEGKLIGIALKPKSKDPSRDGTGLQQD